MLEGVEYHLLQSGVILVPGLETDFGGLYGGPTQSL